MTKRKTMDELVQIARDRVLAMKVARPGGLASSKAIAGDIERAIDALSANLAGPAGITWRCFHCGEIYSDPVEAADHFGELEDMPACYSIVTEGEKAIVEDRRSWRNRALRAEAEVSNLRAPIESQLRRIGAVIAATANTRPVTREQADKISRRAT